ncbi:glycosyltransferase [Legionella lytica]|uniref:Glycosyltransferase n=1 Tax=Legionella lytica TaxID=96232 RepID=A0ABW8DB19_9GAMM
MSQGTANNDDEMILSTFLSETEDVSQNYRFRPIQDDDILGELCYLDDARSIENLAHNRSKQHNYLDSYTFFHSIEPSPETRNKVYHDSHSEQDSIHTLESYNPFRSYENKLKGKFKAGFKRTVHSAISHWEQRIHNPPLLPEQQTEALREKIHFLLKKKKKEIGFSDYRDLLHSLLPQYTNQPFPKNIIYVWTGKAIKPEYLEEIKAVAIHSRAMGFRVLLYVNHPNLFLATQEKLLNTAQIPNLHIHNIKDLTDFALDYFRDPQDANNQTLGTFIVSCLEKERIGLDNYGSYSDIVRLLALLKHGGYYLDTDTLINKKSITKSLGDHFFARASFEGQSSGLGLLYYFHGVRAGNNVIASLQNHPIICLSLLSIAKQYLGAGVRVYGQQFFTFEKSQIALELTKAEAKRVPYDNDFEKKHGRVQLTINMTGPTCLTNSSELFLVHQLEHICAELTNNFKEHEKLSGLKRLSRINYLCRQFYDRYYIPQLFAIETKQEGMLKFGELEVHFDGTWYNKTYPTSFEY